MKPFDVCLLQLDAPSLIPIPKIRSLLGTEDLYSNCSSDLCGTVLLLGLVDGSVCQYHIEQDLGILQARSFISSSPVSRVSVIPSESKCLAYSDGYLYVLNMNLEILTSVKCQAYHVDNLHLSPCRVTASIGTIVQEYNLAEEMVATRKANSEPATKMVRLGSTICMALQSMYIVQDLKHKTRVELFPYQGRPFVEAIQDEFLIVTQSAQGFGIGIFISKLGEPVKVDNF